MAALWALHLVLLYGMVTKTLGPWFNDINHRPGPFVDLWAYTNAGRAWLAGEGIYGHGPAFGFRYHPLFAVLVGAPLSLLPKPAAAGVWIAVHELGLASFVGWLARTARTPQIFVVGTALLLLSTPYLLETYMGNNTFLAGVLLLWSSHLLAARRLGWFAVLFAASIVAKPIGLFLLPVLVFDRAFAPMLGALAAVVLTALPFFWADPAGFRTFVEVNGAAVPGFVVHAGNLGAHDLVVDLVARLNGVGTRRLGSFQQLPMPGRLAVYAWPLGVALLALWGSLRHRDRFLHFFLWSAAFLLWYKDVWEHTYSLAAMSLAWLAATDRAPTWAIVATAVALGAPTGFVLYDLTPTRGIDPEHDWSLAVSVVHHATKAIPLLLLFGWAVVGRSTGAPSSLDPGPSPE